MSQESPIKSLNQALAGGLADLAKTRENCQTMIKYTRLRFAPCVCPRRFAESRVKGVASRMAVAFASGKLIFVDFHPVALAASSVGVGAGAPSGLLAQAQAQTRRAWPPTIHPAPWGNPMAVVPVPQSQPERIRPPQGHGKAIGGRTARGWTWRRRNPNPRFRPPLSVRGNPL